MTVIAIQDDVQRKALLLHAVGENTFDIFMSLADHGTTYNHAKAALTNYFKPKVNKEYERAVFRRLRQETGESIDVYHTRLRKAAASCDFASVDGEIKSHVIQTATDSKLRKQGLTDDTLTVGDIVVAGRNNELAQAQNADMEKDIHCAHVQKVQHRPKQRLSKPSQGKQHRGQTCRNCGNKYPHDGGRESCPAFPRNCYLCDQANHFAKLCPKKGNTHGRRKSKLVHDVDDTKHDEYVFVIDDNVCVESVDMSHATMCGEFDVNALVAKPPKFRVHFKQCSVTMTADSGASCSIIYENTFRQKFKGTHLEKCSADKLNAYGGSRTVTIGCFTATIKSGIQSTSDLFYVVKGNGGNILSMKASQKLGLLTVAGHVVNTAEVKHFPTVFEGIGKLKEFEVKLHIDDNVPPVAQRHRSIPFHQRQKVTAELHDLERNDIIERVNGPTP